MPIQLKLCTSTLLLALTGLAPTAAAQAPGAAYASHGVYSAAGKAWGGYGPRIVSRAPRAIWIPGHNQVVEFQRWVPGGTRREWIPARTRRICGPWRSWREVVIEPGRWVLVPLPGHNETYHQTQWVPGYWTTQAH